MMIKSVHEKRALLSKLLIVQLCCLCTIGITAKTYANNEPAFTASVPNNIEVGTQFRLTFTVTTTKELDDADLTGLSVSIPTGLTILAGPIRTKVSQSRNIGSKIVLSHQKTYTYILSAPQAGMFTIPAASITVKGKTLRSQSLTITVVPAGQATSKQAHQPDVDAFAVMTVSERSPRVNTPVVLECKLYTTVPADSLANMEHFISSKDFKVEPIDLRGSQWQTEHRDGKNYYTAVFRKLLLYPLRTGELHIGNLRMDIYIRQADATIDPFDRFFNGGNTECVKKHIDCPGVTFHVHE